MDSTRKQLAAELEQLLPDTFVVWHYPKSLQLVGDENDGVVVIERHTLTPITSGTFEETFRVWVATGLDDEEAAEDALDKALEEVTGALNAVPWCTPPTATREMYDAQWHAYRLEITLRSHEKESTD